MYNYFYKCILQVFIFLYYIIVNNNIVWYNNINKSNIEIY